MWNDIPPEGHNLLTHKLGCIGWYHYTPMETNRWPEWEYQMCRPLYTHLLSLNVGPLTCALYMFDLSSSVCFLHSCSELNELLV